MRSIGNFLTLVILSTVAMMTSPSFINAENSPGVRTAVFEFLHQYIENATPTAMPMESRIKTAIAASQMQAKALGDDIDFQTLDRAARRPAAFFPASDTMFTWTGASWQGFTRSTYSYTGGKKNSVRTDNWTGVWSNFGLTSWSYNGSNQITSFTYQTWDGGSSSWSNNTRTLLTYDGNSLVSTSTFETWNGSSYSPSAKVVYAYDSNNRVDTLTTQSWLGFWVDNGHTVFTYDGNGNEILAVNQTYLPPTYIWTNSSQTISTYNGSNQLLTETTQTWSGSAWGNTYKFEFEYNGSGDEILDRTSSWQASAWTVTDVDTMRYDGSHRLTQAVHNQITPSPDLSREDYTYDGSGNLIEMISLAYDAGWDNVSRMVIVYTSLAVKVDDTALPGDFALLQNHPNPFNPTTTIRYSLSRPHLVQIEVYNVLGQLVSTLENSEQGVGVYETTWDGTNANGQDVASGVYFYRLKAGEFVQTRKMVLSR